MSSKTDVVMKWEDESWRNPPSSMITANEMYLSDDYQSLDKDGNLMGDKAFMNASSQMLFKSLKGFRGGGA